MESAYRKHVEKCGTESETMTVEKFKDYIEASAKDAYKCENCSKPYKTEKGLRNHVCKPEKKKIEPMACTICAKEYKTEKGLQNHKCSVKN
jgi:rubredoxin